jgi:hypothetical protein
MEAFDQRDEALFRIHSAIVTDGVYVPHFPGEGGKPPFACTVGLMERAHPEVIVFGLDRQQTADVIGNLFDEIDAGIRHPVGRNRRLIHFGCPPWTVRLLRVAPQCWECAGDHWLCLPRSYYRALGRPPEALWAVQLVWATRGGRFPWHAKATPADRWRQPLLDQPLRAL